MSEEEQTPEEIAQEIRDGFADDYQDYDLDEMVDDIESFKQMGVNEDEIERAVTTSVADSLGVDRSELLGLDGDGGNGGGGSDEVTVAEAKELGDEQWVTLEVTPVDVDNEHDSDAVAQIGTLGDETGTIRFISWTKSELDSLEEDKSYRLENVVTDEYEGNINVKLNKATEIEEIDEEIEIGDNSTTVEGNLVHIKRERSGLIKRNAETGEYVTSDEGIETEHDLRIMGVIDDGHQTHEIVIGKELTEELTEISLDEATEMAMEALDMDVVADAMSERILGRYYRVEGVQIGRYLNADDVTVLEEPEFDESLLIEARSMQQ